MKGLRFGDLIWYHQSDTKSGDGMVLDYDDRTSTITVWDFLDREVKVVREHIAEPVYDAYFLPRDGHHILPAHCRVGPPQERFIGGSCMCGFTCDINGEGRQRFRDHLKKCLVFNGITALV